LSGGRKKAQYTVAKSVSENTTQERKMGSGRSKMEIRGGSAKPGNKRLRGRGFLVQQSNRKRIDRKAEES